MFQAFADEDTLDDLVPSSEDLEAEEEGLEDLGLDLDLEEEI